jgi:hypothetical protein
METLQPAVKKNKQPTIQQQKQKGDFSCVYIFFSGHLEGQDYHSVGCRTSKWPFHKLKFELFLGSKDRDYPTKKTFFKLPKEIKLPENESVKKKKKVVNGEYQQIVKKCGINRYGTFGKPILKQRAFNEQNRKPCARKNN